MRRLVVGIVLCSWASGWAVSAQAQGRGATDWMTNHGDAQRSSWIRTDAKISKDTLQKPGFQFLWKLKLKNEPNQLNSLRQPILLELLIGYRGFRALGFVAGSSNKLFAVDTDLGRMEWQKQLPLSAPPAGAAPSPSASLACPGGMTAGVTRPTLATFPSALAGGSGFGGRRSPARSAVGDPGQGAVTLAQVRPTPPVPAPAPVAPAKPPAPSLPSLFGRGPFLIHALSSDGMLHTMHLSNGADAEPPARFVPPNADAQGLIVVDNAAYVMTQGGCGGVPNGVWALDLASKQVATWKGHVSGSAGPAFDAEGNLYVTTGAEGELPFSLVALEPKTLKVKGWYTAGKQEFTSSPVIFQYQEKTLIAAATKDGQIHLLDSADLNRDGADHQTPLSKSPTSGTAGSFVPGALTSWQGTDGTRWILAPVGGTITAWKVVPRNGVPTLQSGWVSRELVSPLPPTIINGVVFVVSSGEFRSADGKSTAAQRIQRSSRAVLYALDATNGKELWNSGTTITSFVRGGSLSGGGGQVYLATHDGTLYAFGFPMEH